MQTLENIKEISEEDLHKKITKVEKFTLVDVLNPDYYKKEHIPGAINIPVHDEKFEEHVLAALPDKNEEIIVYCANSSCSASPNAARKLQEMGYTRVSDFEGGIQEWKEAGHKTETN